jgi:Ca2+-dependent lipid-binding protein
MDIPKIKQILSEGPEKRINEQSQIAFSGSLQICILSAGILKTTSQSGKANPYVVFKIPEKLHQRGSVGSITNSTAAQDKKIELLKSRVLNDNINPVWKETFEASLSNAEKLEVYVYSKNNNMLFSDELLGSTILDIKIGTEIRRRIASRKSQILFIDLEPQGRLMIEVLNEGEPEDTNYWFRKTRARLIRAKDEFLRNMTEKVEFKIDL